MRTDKVSQHFAVGMAVGLLVLSQVLGEPAPSIPKGKVRLFILSGQSNMVYLDETKSFTPTIKKAFPEDEVIVVKYAQGGTPMFMWYKEWKAPAGADVSWTEDNYPGGVPQRDAPPGREAMDWKLALVQHPMYFLIRVGSQCAETIDIAHDCGYFARCGYMEGEL